MLCENVIQDKQDRMSFINVIQNVKLDQIPGALTQLFVVVAFECRARSTMSIVITTPENQELFTSGEFTITGETPANLPSVHMRSLTIVALALKVTVFQTEGIHNVVLRQDGRVIHQEPFGVFKVPLTGGLDAQLPNNPT